jgi:hypothetical protein
LIIEADGGQHNASQHDATRDAYLKAQGFRVLRFWNNDVLKNIDAVLENIRLAIGEAPSPSIPLPPAGEGRKAGLAPTNVPLPQAGEECSAICPGAPVALPARSNTKSRERAAPQARNRTSVNGT